MNETIADRPPLSPRDLRVFGLTVGLAFGTIFGVILPWLRHANLRGWPWLIAMPVLIAAVAAPQSLRRFHSLWMSLAHRLGAIQSRILLTIVYFLVVTPLGLLRRSTRNVRGFDSGAKTYRIASVARMPRSMERPF